MTAKRAHESPDSVVTLFLVSCLLLMTTASTYGQKAHAPPLKPGQQEEREDYFQKWLNDDVVYIITDEEREVFEDLSTPEEKERFIEQFWQRRDSDLRTSINEFKEEHYRRIAYANERFSVGQPGWMSDRGRIYIMHGPPDQLESHPTGGQYQRPSWEGGGWTQTYPFEIWRYRYIEGIGPEVELEFVDRSLSGQFQLALHPWQKDALLYSGNSGATISEILGQSTKADRPSLNPLNRNRGFRRLEDTPFERYTRFARVQSPVPIRYRDLQEVVKVNLTYDDLPCNVRIDYFRLSQTQVLVPITLELRDEDLTFKNEAGSYSAEVAVYGIITSITKRVVQEFEDELVTSYKSGNAQTPGTGRSLYQKTVVLDIPTRYKLDLVVKDLESGRIGVAQTAIVPPRYDPERFSISSLVLSDYLYILEALPEENQMFVLGDVWMHPSPTNQFSLTRPLMLYFQLYHLGTDQTTEAPSLRLTYQISRNGETVLELLDESAAAVQYFSSERLVIIQELPIAGLQAGRHHLEVRVEDRIAGRTVSARTDFELSEQGAASGG